MKFEVPTTITGRSNAFFPCYDMGEYKIRIPYNRSAEDASYKNAPDKIRNEIWDGELWSNEVKFYIAKILQT